LVLFQRGSELRVDHVTALAFLNTDIAASFAAVTWLVLAWILEKKPNSSGFSPVRSQASLRSPRGGVCHDPVCGSDRIIAGVVCYGAISLKTGFAG
jgi:Amt family ammonium transporter